MPLGRTEGWRLDRWEELLGRMTRKQDRWPVSLRGMSRRQDREAESLQTVTRRQDRQAESEDDWKEAARRHNR